MADLITRPDTATTRDRRPTTRCAERLLDDPVAAAAAVDAARSGSRSTAASSRASRARRSSRSAATTGSRSRPSATSPSCPASGPAGCASSRSRARSTRRSRCSRACEPEMKVQTQTEELRRLRRTNLELIFSRPQRLLPAALPEQVPEPHRHPGLPQGQRRGRLARVDPDLQADDPVPERPRPGLPGAVRGALPARRGRRGDRHPRQPPLRRRPGPQGDARRRRRSAASRSSARRRPAGGPRSSAPGRPAWPPPTTCCSPATT